MLSKLGVSLGVVLVGAGLARGPANPAAYEVWVADQNGDKVYVLNADGAVQRTLDLAALVSAKRPHTLHLASDGRAVFVANTVSNQATIHALPGGDVIARIDAVGKSPHAVQPHPSDPARAYVSNIGPRGASADGQPDRGETITELVRQPDGKWQVGRRLDLRGEPALADTTRFPSRRPVLVGFSADGRRMLVTLFHGGVAVVDLDAWRVSRAWGADEVHHHGTVATASPDRQTLFVTAGSATTSWLYVFDVSAEPRLVATHDLAAWGKDAHGAAVRPGTRELWVVHRASGTITIHPLDQIRAAHTPAVVRVGAEIPDLVEFAPDGSRAFLTLRGPNPAPTIPFPLAGKTPGVAIVDGVERRLLTVVPLGDPQQGDFHGVAIIRLERPRR